MSGRGHRTVPHTADLRVEAWAPTREECLAEAVRGLVDSFAVVARGLVRRTAERHLAASDVAVAAGSASTLLAGWEPDQTLWLTDVFTKAEHLPSWRGSPGSEAMPGTVPPWLGHRAAAGDESSH